MAEIQPKEAATGTCTEVTSPMAKAESTSPRLQNRPTQVKLRSACDRCSSNKVKCSQERPGCQRCRSLNLPCHYSRSMRMGKPPRSRQRSNRACCHLDPDGNSPNLKPLKPAAPAPAPPPTPPAPAPAPAPAVTTAIPNAAAVSNPMLDDQLPSQANGVVTTLLPSWPDEFDYQSLLGDDDLSFQPLTPGLFDILGDSTAMAPGYSQPLLSDCPDILSDLSKQVDPMSKMLESSLHNPMYERLTPVSLNAFPFPTIRRNSDNQYFMDTVGSAGPSHTSPCDRQCVRVAMETLDCLYQLSSSAHSFDAGPSGPTVDHILQVNSDAMEAAASVLACPCTKDFGLLVILALVPCKALAGYQAVVNMSDPHIQVAAGEATVSHPIAVGSYTLDEEASRMVIMQVVLAKLRELSRFVQTYIDTFCFDANRHRQGHCGLVYRTLALFVQSRLGTTTEGLQEKLSTLLGDGNCKFK